MKGLRPTEYPNVMSDGDNLYTRNLSEGHSVYGELLVNFDESEYRRWNPRRSKLAAYLLLSNASGDLRSNDTILYLGAASGTTVSHISDIVNEGTIYAVEISKRAFRELLANCSDRSNIVPILGDARNTDHLSTFLDQADYLYEDIAQRDQVGIFTSCMRRFRCRTGMLMLKCRSIDVSASPKAIAGDAEKEIEESGLTVKSVTDLSNFEKDHFALLVKR